MTPQEKAIELVNKYNNNDHLYYSITIEQAKQCALIAVDEILKVMNDIWLDSFKGGESDNKFYNYWKKVKKEIEKI